MSVDNKKIQCLFAIAVVGLLILSLMAVSMHTKGLAAGGEITNLAPLTPSDLLGTISSKTNAATEQEYFTGTVNDTNGEPDIAFVNWTSTYGGAGPYPAERPAGGWTVGKPSSGNGINLDGIAVWNDTAVKNGNLSYQVRHTWSSGATAGTYTQKITVADASTTTESDPDDTTEITTYVSVIWEVCETTNATVSSGVWTFPSSAPGTPGVNSTRWLRANNTGSGAATLSVSFTDFTNETSGDRIDVTYNDNIKFRFNSTPEKMNDTANTTWNADTDGSIGSISLAPGAYMFFAYKIVAIPYYIGGNQQLTCLVTGSAV